jgi:hypothetical protein
MRTLIRASRRWRARFLLPAAVVAAVITASLTLTGGIASAAAAPANTGNACNAQGDPNSLVCINITGHGLYIGTVTGWWVNESGTTYGHIHLELTGPNGKLIKNGPTITVKNGKRSPNITWDPRKYVKGGYYCVVVWWNYARGLYSNFGNSCPHVRS